MFENVNNQQESLGKAILYPSGLTNEERAQVLNLSEGVKIAAAGATFIFSLMTLSSLVRMVSYPILGTTGLALTIPLSLLSRDAFVFSKNFSNHVVTSNAVRDVANGITSYVGRTDHLVNKFLKDTWVVDSLFGNTIREAINSLADQTRETINNSFFGN